MSLEDKLYPLLRSYNALPGWVRRPVGRAYRFLPPSWRYGSCYRGFKDLAAAGEKWDTEQIQAYQLKQLRIVLHHAANHCPFYQKTFARAGFRPESLRTLEDLAECPLLDRST